MTVLMTAKFSPRVKKILGLLIVILIIVAIVFIGAQRSGLTDMETGGMTVTPSTLVGGEMNNITIMGAGSGVLLTLPWSFIALGDNGTFCWEKELTITGNDYSLEVLVSPWVDAASINITKGGRNHTFEFSVEPGHDPLVTGEGMYDYLSYLTGNFPHRQTGIPGHYAAADWIKSQLDDMGLESEIRHYRWSDRGSEIFGPGTFINKPVSDILVVVGFKKGLIENEWIVVGGHFDNAVGNRQPGEGAYDNGSGTCMMLELARAISQMETRYSFVFAAWGGEEEGLIGAQRFVEDLPSDIDVKFYLNMDMVGIGYPSDFPIHMQVGPNQTAEIDHEELWSIVENVTYEGMNISRNDSRIILNEGTGGGSDHTPFQRVDVPTVFMITDWDYPAYHGPEDTLEFMIQYIGSEEELVESFDCDTWICLFICLNVDGCESIHQGEVPYG
jgi:hypothetical protein